MEEKEITEQVEKSPLGFTAKTDVPAMVTFQQFFDVMRIVDTLNTLISLIKQENFKADNMRYYFDTDLVETTDENGKIVKTLREDFWSKEQPNQI